MNKLIVGFLISCIVIIGLSVYYGIEEEQNWEQFKIDYRCKIVGKTSSTSHLGISSSGNAVVISESAKTSWLCSDGITYTR